METGGGLRSARLLFCCCARSVGNLRGCKMGDCSKQGSLFRKLGTLDAEPIAYDV
jgi:hypothetical protein